MFRVKSEMLSVLLIVFVLIQYNLASTDTEYPLYTIFDGSTKLTTDDLKLIAESFNAAQSGLNSSAAKLVHSFNPNFKVFRYTDDWAIVNLTDAEYNKTSPARYSFGTLTSSLTNSASDTTINLKLFSHFKQIPFKQSSTSSAYSSDCTHYVSWIRVDNEFMKVTSIDHDSNSKLLVERGYIGNGNLKPILSTHNKNATIFAPVFSGPPPGSSDCDKTFRYMLNPESEYAVTHYANMTLNDIRGGLDGSWYDNWGAFPPQPQDGLGDGVAESQIWNDDGNDYFTDCNKYRIAQQNRLTAIYNELSTKYKLNPNSVTIWANNMASQHYQMCDLYKFLVSDAPSFPYPLDGYCMEGYAVHQSGSCDKNSIEWLSLDKWNDNVNELINVTSMGIAGMPMMMQAGCKAKGMGKLADKLYEQVTMFGYVTYLMGVTSRINSSSFFGVYGLKEENNKLYAYIDDVFFYKIGNPIEKKQTVSQYKINGHISYQRSFENGITVINPNNKTDSGLVLSKEYFNPQTNKTVKDLDVAGHTAYILLNQ